LSPAVTQGNLAKWPHPSLTLHLRYNIQPALGLHNEATNRKLILCTQIGKIKPQQLPSYFMLQRPEYSGRPSRGESRLERPGLQEESPKRGWQRARQPPPSAPLGPAQGAPCKSPILLICIRISSFPYPPALGGRDGGDWLTADPFVFPRHPGTCSLVLQNGGKRKKKESEIQKREGGQS
jgi:hypothetical protein